jgi:type I restriction enzyme M protein
MFEQTFKNIDDILHKDAGCTSELDYTEQSSWLLFLKYLDALEADRAAEAELEGRAYSFILAEPFRWGRWAAPKNAEGRADHHTALTGHWCWHHQWDTSGRKKFNICIGRNTAIWIE